MEMQVRLKTGGAVKIEGESQADLFAEWAAVEEVFNEPGCGICGCEDIYPVVRKVDDNVYNELACRNPECRARLSFGAHKKGGGLFPKRKLIKDGPEKGKPDMENGMYDNKCRGWTKFRGLPKKD